MTLLDSGGKMEKEHLKIFAKFNKESNDSMNNIIKTLTDEQWKKQFSGYYKSILEICGHIYFWDYNTLVRFKSIRNYSYLDEFQYEKDLDIFTLRITEEGQEYLHENFTSSKSLFSNSSIAEYLKMRIDLDNRMVKLVNEITESDLTKVINLTTITGNKFEKSLGGLLFEIFVHDIHHRGMISLYLEMLGKENDFYSDPCQVFWSYK